MFKAPFNIIVKKTMPAVNILVETAIFNKKAHDYLGDMRYVSFAFTPPWYKIKHRYTNVLSHGTPHKPRNILPYQSVYQTDHMDFHIREWKRYVQLPKEVILFIC